MKFDNNTSCYPISVAAKLSETPLRMLREYEKRGLIKPNKINNRRMFTNNEIGFIKDIRYLFTQKKMTISGIKEFYSKASCWEIKQCYQKNCPAYHKLDKQCWEVVEHHKLCDGKSCPSCPIYIVKTSLKAKVKDKYSSHFTYQPNDLLKR
jgi:MerR family transcriptional regulator/heat shock protein HspR